ncbi:hypothetical protein BDV93DRAFT_525684 [Ceratobasidium sp. AG-I]|nr:hypothetical protein BDV93DRAFT_525684 [Ceratobasidium sp. AG-I]
MAAFYFRRFSSKTTLDPLSAMQSHLPHCPCSGSLISRRSWNWHLASTGSPRIFNSSLSKDAVSERPSRAEALIARRCTPRDTLLSVGEGTPLNVHDGSYSDGSNEQEMRGAHMLRRVSARSIEIGGGTMIQRTTIVLKAGVRSHLASHTLTTHDTIVIGMERERQGQ